MKGQRKGVRSTKVTQAVEIESKMGKDQDSLNHAVPIKKMNDIFVTM